MNKKILLLFAMVLMSISAMKAQAPNTLWAKKMGGTGSDIGKGIAVDATGNVYTTGTFKGTADFDPGTGTFNLVASGENDIFVSKIDASGNFLWAKKIGGSGDDYGNGIGLDASGNVYTTGSFNGTVDFNPGIATDNLISAGFTDIFVSKLDANGNFVWAKSMGGTNDDIGYNITLDASGNVYTTGSFQLTADFDPSGAANNLISAGITDIFVSKLDASGQYIWAKRFGSVNNDYGYDIALDALGNVYTTGFFDEGADFDPGPSTFTLSTPGDFVNADIFVSKLDANGNFVWAKGMGGIGNDEGLGIKVDNAGNVYTTGRFVGTGDFDPSAVVYNLPSTNVDIFVSKLDVNGIFVWAKSFGGTTVEDIGKSIALDDAGNIYTTGKFQGFNADFDPGPQVFTISNSGSDDIFVSKLNNSGDFVWAKRMGGTGAEHGNDIAVESNGNIYVTGFFPVTANFNPSGTALNLSSSGSYDIFIATIGVSCATTNSTITANICQGSTYTFNSIAQSTAGTYFDTLVNANGCDSIITLNLSIIQPQSAFSQTICIGNSYAFNGQNLTAAGIYYDTLISAGGCDSIVTLNLIVNSPNTGSSTLTELGSYLFNATTYTTSGTYTGTFTNAAGCDSVHTLNLTIIPITPPTVTLSNNIAGALVDYTFTYTTTISVPATEFLFLAQRPLWQSGFPSFQSVNPLTSSNLEIEINNIPQPLSSFWIVGSFPDNLWIRPLNLIPSNSNIVIKFKSIITNPNLAGPYLINWRTAMGSGVAIQQFSNTITIAPSCATTYSSFNQSICQGNSYSFNGQNLTSLGTYYDTLLNAGGCDSLVTLNLSIKATSTSTTNLTICSHELPYTWNGLSFTAAGTQTANLTNSVGCDSAATLNLSVTPSTTASTINITACGSYTWNGNTYINSGTYISPLIGCNVNVLNLTITHELLLSAKAFLLGAYDSTLGKMHDSLRVKNLIPTLEPYTASPFNRAVIGETSGETVSPAVLAVTGDNAIVDWVFVELRSAANSATVVATKRALIQRDGDIVSAVDGVSPIAFFAMTNDNYFVSIKHRNHLGIISLNTLSMSSCVPAVIDFTNSNNVYTLPLNPNPLVTNYPARKLIGSTYLMWSGDALRNKNVKYNGLSNDKDAVLNALGGALANPSVLNNTLNNVYRSEDNNLDGKVRYNNADNDRVIILSNLGNQSNNIINHHTPN
jgi:Beta-propeller repeat